MGNAHTEYIFENHMPYTVISNQLIKDKDLSLKARGLASFMCSQSESGRFSISNLAEDTGEGETAIRSALKELIKRGYLVRTKTKNSQGFFVYKYDFYSITK